MHYHLRQCSEADRTWAYALKCEVYREVVERQFGWWDEEKQQRLFASHWHPAIMHVIQVAEQAIGLLAVEDRPDEL